MNQGVRPRKFIPRRQDVKTERLMVRWGEVRKSTGLHWKELLASLIRKVSGEMGVSSGGGAISAH